MEEKDSEIDYSGNSLSELQIMKVLIHGYGLIHRVALAQIFLILLLVLPTTTLSALPQAEAFARLPTYGDLDLSPNGKFLAGLTNIENQYVVVVYDISGSSPKFVHAVRESDVCVAS